MSAADGELDEDELALLAEATDEVASSGEAQFSVLFNAPDMDEQMRTDGVVWMMNEAPAGLDAFPECCELEFGGRMAMLCWFPTGDQRAVAILTRGYATGFQVGPYPLTSVPNFNPMGRAGDGGRGKGKGNRGGKGGKGGGGRGSGLGYTPPPPPPGGQSPYPLALGPSPFVGGTALTTSEFRPRSVNVKILIVRGDVWALSRADQLNLARKFPDYIAPTGLASIHEAAGLPVLGPTFAIIQRDVGRLADPDPVRGPIAKIHMWIAKRLTKSMAVAISPCGLPAPITRLTREHGMRGQRLPRGGWRMAFCLPEAQGTVTLKFTHKLDTLRIGQSGAAEQVYLDSRRDAEQRLAGKSVPWNVVNFSWACPEVKLKAEGGASAQSAVDPPPAGPGLGGGASAAGPSNKQPAGHPKPKKKPKKGSLTDLRSRVDATKASYRPEEHLSDLEAAQYIALRDEWCDIFPLLPGPGSGDSDYWNGAPAFPLEEGGICSFALFHSVLRGHVYVCSADEGCCCVRYPCHNPGYANTLPPIRLGSRVHSLVKDVRASRDPPLPAPPDEPRLSGEELKAWREEQEARLQNVLDVELTLPLELGDSNVEEAQLRAMADRAHAADSNLAASLVPVWTPVCRGAAPAEASGPEGVASTGMDVEQESEERDRAPPATEAGDGTAGSEAAAPAAVAPTVAPLAAAQPLAAALSVSGGSAMASHHSTPNNTPKRPPTPMETGAAPSPKRQEVQTGGGFHFTDSELETYEQELSLEQHASQVDAVHQHQLD